MSGDTMRPEAVSVPGWTWPDTAMFDPATTVGSLVLTCGVPPFDPSGTLVGRGDFEAQVRVVVSNLRQILEAAGSGMDLIARQCVYLRRAEDLAEFRRLRAELYTPPYPASVAVVVTALAHPDMLIEIAAEAVVRSPRPGDAPQ